MQETGTRCPIFTIALKAAVDVERDAGGSGFLVYIHQAPCRRSGKVSNTPYTSGYNKLADSHYSLADDTA